MKLQHRCNDDQGAHIMCNGTNALDGNGDWMSIPADVIEKKPEVELFFEDDSMITSGNKAQDTAMTAEKISELSSKGLHIQLLRWQDSNHVCSSEYLIILFSKCMLFEITIGMHIL